MTQRLRSNFKTGTIASLNTGSETLNFPNGSSGLGNITITSGTGVYLPLVINPASFNSTASPASEIVWVYDYSSGATTAKVWRHQEGTSDPGVNWPTGTVLAHGSLARDFTLVSGIVNGDFPAPTASGQWFVSQASGAVNPAWVDAIPTTKLSGTLPASGVVGALVNATISGSSITGNINATQISGGLVQSTTLISGSQIVSNIAATQVSGGALQGSVTISGSQVYGALLNTTTISGSQVVGNIVATQISGGLVQNSVRISGSQVVSNIAATQISGGLLQSSTQISGNQVVSIVSGATTANNLTGNINTTQINGGLLPATVQISGAQVVSNISATQISGGLVQNSVRISGNQVVGNISATQVSGGALQSSVIISGSTITSAVVSGIIDLDYGFINYGQYTYPVLTGPGLIDGHHSGTTWISGIVNVSTTISGVSESNVVISGRNILASAISGTISSDATISGGQVFGTINATQISGRLSKTTIPLSGVVTNTDGVPVYHATSPISGVDGNWSFNYSPSLGTYQTATKTGLAPVTNWYDVGLTITSQSYNTCLLVGTATITNGDTSNRTFQVRVKEQLTSTILQSRQLTVSSSSGVGTITFVIPLGNATYSSSSYSFIMEAIQNAGTATGSNVTCTLQQVVLA